MNALVSASPMLRASRLVVAAGLAWTVLAGLAAGDGAARRTAALADDYRIVISSNREGKTRPYSILSNGSGLAPLLAGGRRLMPVAVSRNGGTIAFTGGLGLADPTGPIWISRADGTGLHRLVKGDAFGPILSPDGRFVAFSPQRGGVSLVRMDGRGRRSLLSRRFCCAADWSPDGKALLVDEGDTILIVPLHGKRRVIARTGPIEDASLGTEQTIAKWSPNGRWIAFLNTEDEIRKNGLYLVRPNGKQLHRIVRGPVITVAWSADGTKLAFTHDDGYVGVVRVDGRRPIRVGRLRAFETPAWAPDGRSFAVAGRDGDDPTEVWLVNEDGRSLRRVTSEGENSMIGWTRRKPSRAPAAPIPPSERVLDARSAATLTPITALSADGTRVAFVAKARPSDCEHAAVWTPGEPSIARFELPAPCPSEAARVRDVTLAGSRVAWTYHRSESEGECSVGLETTTLVNPQPIGIHAAGPNKASCAPDYYHVRGDGDLLVFNDETRLKRIGAGRMACNPNSSSRAKICATLRRNVAGSVDSVSGTSIAVRRPGAVTVFDEGAQLVRQFPFSPADVRAARLDNGRLVVWRFGVLEVYDVATGTRVRSYPVPTGFRLVDADGGVAVLLGGVTINLLRLDDGASRTITPGGAPVLADLEPPGLYYSYAVGGGGRVTLLPRSEAEPARRAG